MSCAKEIRLQVYIPSWWKAPSTRHSKGWLIWHGTPLKNVQSILIKCFYIGKWIAAPIHKLEHTLQEDNIWRLKFFAKASGRLSYLVYLQPLRAVPRQMILHIIWPVTSNIYFHDWSDPNLEGGEWLTLNTAPLYSESHGSPQLTSV